MDRMGEVERMELVTYGQETGGLSEPSRCESFVDPMGFE